MWAGSVRGMDTSVAGSWRRITDWLERHAPVTAAAVRPSAGVGEADRTAAAVGLQLPRDLRDWWALMDGVADYRAGFPIPPCYLPLPVAEVRQRHAELARFADRECCGGDGSHATVAGETIFGFCTATVPICWDLAGDVLVLDLRGGPRRGWVMAWGAEDGYFGTRWSGTSAMLADVAGRFDDAGQTEVVDGGAVQWTAAAHIE